VVITDPGHFIETGVYIGGVSIPTNTDPEYTTGGIRCLGGVSIPTNTDPWIYQRRDQVRRRSKHPYKHRPLDIPEVGSGV
jgi:hypothetical protein